MTNGINIIGSNKPSIKVTNSLAGYYSDLSRAYAEQAKSYRDEAKSYADILSAKIENIDEQTNTAVQSIINASDNAISEFEEVVEQAKTDYITEVNNQLDGLLGV